MLLTAQYMHVIRREKRHLQGLQCNYNSISSIFLLLSAHGYHAGSELTSSGENNREREREREKYSTGVYFYVFK